MKKSGLKGKIRYYLMQYRKHKRLTTSKQIIDAQGAKWTGILQNEVVHHPCVFFACVPQHTNMGDQAQRSCIEKWIQENYEDYPIYEIPTWPFYSKMFKKVFESQVKQDDIIVIQSGYCTTDSHIDHDVHRWIAKRFSTNAILIMPQTVNFQFRDSIIKTERIYRNCKHLLLLTRDRHSYEMAKEYFPSCNIALYPDIVTTMIGSRKRSEDRDGVLLCVRNDGEKKYGNDQIENIRQFFSQKDISCDLTDTNSDKALDYLRDHFDAELDTILDYFSHYRVVITDRYHGTIFSMIANTPVIVLATNDHKVKTGTEWFKGIYDGAFFNAETIDDAIRIADECISGKISVNNKPYFQEKYYNKLKTQFEKVLGYEKSFQKNIFLSENSIL